jgi:pilus assembly protein CpaB
VVLSVVLGVLAVIMMLVYQNRQESSLLQLAEMKDVLVATQDILQNTVIDERLVQQIQVPAKFLQPRAIADTREVVGRIVTVPVPRGAQLLGTFLEDVGSEALAYEVPRSQRAVTIAVDDVTGVAGLLRPGNFVDIIGTFDYGKPAGYQQGRLVYTEEKTETLTLMQNVQVVAVERQHQREQPPPQQATPGLTVGQQAANQQAQARTQAIRNITVLVSPQQVQELVLAQNLGNLTLALRSNLDAGEVTNLGRLDALGLLKVPVPPKPRAQPVWREFRGTGVGVF